MKINIKSQLFTLGDGQADALWDWAMPRWRTEAGGGIDWQTKSAKFSFKMGYDGSYKVKNFGLGIALLVGLDKSLAWSTGGTVQLGLMASVLLFHPLTQVGPVMESGAKTFKQARLDGLSRLSAFARMSKKMARSMLGKSTPNIWIAGAAASVPFSWATIKVGHAAAKKWPNGSRVQSSADWAAGKIDGVGVAAMRQYEKLSAWKFKQELEAAKIAGASEAGLEAYGELARMWSKRRLFVGLQMDDDTKALLDTVMSAKGKEAREQFEAWLKSAPDGSEDLGKAMDLAEASGAGSWFKPSPGLPSMYELASSVDAFNDAFDGPSDDHKDRLSAWRAKQEAEYLKGIVGEAHANGARPARMRL